MKLFKSATNFEHIFLQSFSTIQRSLSALRAFQLCFSSNCFGDLYLWSEGLLLEAEDPSTVYPLPHNFSTSARCYPPPNCCSSPVPPHLLPGASPVANFEKPIAENTQFYTNFHNFFQTF